VASAQYRYPVGSGLKDAGIDQGHDWTGAGPIYAVGDAKISRVVWSGSGWPGIGAVIDYEIVSGPLQGQYVYNAEDLVPTQATVSAFEKGTVLPMGTIIANATGSGQAPGIEIGWADPSGLPSAPRPPPRPASQWTSYGQDFANFLKAILSGDPNTDWGSFGSQHGGAEPQPTPGGTPTPEPGPPGTTGGSHSGPNVREPTAGDTGAGFFGTAGIPSELFGALTGWVKDLLMVVWEWISNYALRGIEILGGGILVLLGLYMLAKGDIPSAVPVPV